MSRNLVKCAVLIGALMLLTGCTSGEQHGVQPSASTSGNPQGLTQTPVLDPVSGLWLSDGWPVPAPDATFDPNIPWRSSTEESTLLAECMTGNGWSVTVTPSGAIETTLPPGQKSAYDTDSKQCRVDHRVGINPGPVPTKELASTEYAAQVRAVQCLRGMGKDVPEMPSYQVFEDALLIEDRIVSVYDLAYDAGMDLSEDQSVRQQCPNPTDRWGYNS